MNEAGSYLFRLARRTAAIYADNPLVRAIMVTGSIAEEQSDYYSDIDMTIYYAALPSEEELAAARARNRGSERIWLLGTRDDGGFAEAYMLHGVECQIGHTTIEAWEHDMAVVQEQLDVTSPLQKALSGTLECIPLYGEPYIQRWKERAAAYPDALARAMVAHYLKFFPVWGLLNRFAPRDATLWLHQARVENAQNILGVLAGLNRRYYTTFQFKRMRRFIATLPIAPPELAARIEALFQADISTAADELEVLVQETVGLVEAHMPDVDTSGVRRRLGWRQQPWQPVELDGAP